MLKFPVDGHRKPRGSAFGGFLGCKKPGEAKMLKFPMGWAHVGVEGREIHWKE